MKAPPRGQSDANPVAPGQRDGGPGVPGQLQLSVKQSSVYVHSQQFADNNAPLPCYPIIPKERTSANARPRLLPKADFFLL